MIWLERKQYKSTTIKCLARRENEKEKKRQEPQKGMFYELKQMLSREIKSEIKQTETKNNTIIRNWLRRMKFKKSRNNKSVKFKNKQTQIKQKKREKQP